MRQQSAVKALIGPLSILVLLLIPLLYIAVMPGGGHPNGTGLAVFFYVFYILPYVAPVGFLLSLLACLKHPDFSVPAGVFCVAYGLLAVACWLLRLWLHSRTG